MSLDATREQSPRDTQGSREDAVPERFRLEVADAKNEKDEQGERGDDQQPAHDDVGSASTPPKANLVVPQTVHVAVLSPRTLGRRDKHKPRRGLAAA